MAEPTIADRNSSPRPPAIRNAASPTKVLERRSHNDLLPIHRLPPELLCAVIEYTYTEGSYKHLFALRSICKLWMEIVDSMPQLWAQIAVHHGADLLSEILRKSTTHPLDVSCKEDVIRSDLDFKEQVAIFLQHVGPSAGRWRSLRYTARMDAPHQRILGLPLHNLETLTVKISGNSVKYPDDLNAPRLRNLDVTRLPLNWGSLSDLLSLQIDGCIPSPTADELYILLKSSPHLELFKIARDRASATGSATNLSDVHSTPILLPRLRTLLVIQVPYVFRSCLLDLVEAPNLHRLVVWQHFLDRSHESAGRFIGAPTHSRGDGGTDRLTVFGTIDLLGVVVGHRRVLINNSGWAQAERSAALSAVLRYFDRPLCESIKVIQISGLQGNQEMVDLAEVLNRHFPNVEQMETKVCKSSSTLSILGRLSSSPTETREAWLFPGLVSLQFNVPKGLAYDEILEVLKARWNVVQVQAIRQLTIEGGKIRRDTVDELRTYLQELKIIGTEVG
ncbi:hypothetical protein FRC01_005415 [Tulasnella sp. 417]|nr:hypothetical protein FRC01_005415 [Tulasnella sp. 417]